MTTDGACVFIDAENISPYAYHRIIKKINEFTYIQSVKAFTDWSCVKPTIKRWIDLAKNNSCIEKISYPHIGLKNTSDILLTIHAIEMLNTPTNSFGVFVLCSADSDFSPLITHMKNKGKITIGFGGKNCSAPYKRRFDFYFDVTPQSDMVIKQSRAIFSLGGEDLNNPKYLGAINLIREAVRAHEKPGNIFVKLSDVGLFLKSHYQLSISDLGFSGSLSDFISLYPSVLNITSDYKACSLIR
ncbi:NYN domain-containing protein [uncultured Tolumonas sp.]|uniref:NYN domain-containing protein n=1 Tax=uncultured Tolumonas sp. TaxID=263765 RepID=UPI002A0A152F|nr:NYN domain-containing protein [uncultured Tolumonas sp.]